MGRASKSSSRETQKHREIPFADETQFYARVTKMLGDSRILAVRADDGAEVSCKIRGSMQRRRCVLAVGDWILASKRDELAGEKADVVDKFSLTEVRYLKRIGEIRDVSKGEEEDVVDDEFVAFEDDPDDADIDAI